MTLDAHRQTNRRRASVVASLLMLLVVAPALASDQTLRFKVFLDQDPIGEHSFSITDLTEGQQVLSEARFDVSLWVLNVYRYRHQSRELWRDGCLERIRASTDDNGTTFELEGERRSGALTLRTNDERSRLNGCVMTFAYWDRDFLDQRRLLNPQTGEMVAVEVEPIGPESIRFSGRDIPTTRYRLSAEGLDISLWYSDEHGWVALSSDTGKGKTIRYERIPS